MESNQLQNAMMKGLKKTNSMFMHLRDQSKTAIVDIVYGKDVLDAQIALSCDLLINEILYMFAQLPVNITFWQMIPKF